MCITIVLFVRLENKRWWPTANVALIFAGHSGQLGLSTLSAGDWWIRLADLTPNWSGNPDGDFFSGDGPSDQASPDSTAVAHTKGMNNTVKHGVLELLTQQ